MDHNRDDIIDDLITRSLMGEASEGEQKQLASWIAQSKENERHYLDLSKTLELGGQYYATGDRELEVNVDQEWNRFIHAVAKKGKGVAMVPTQRAPKVWLKIAAVLLLLVTSGLVVNYFVSKNATTVYTTGDNYLTVDLPDESRIELNRNSELTYSSSFGKEKREINLKGEAFFEVARNPQKPFVIQIDEARVEVLGTSFNIRGGNDTRDLEVTVETGIVSLSGPDNAGGIKLAAGEKGTYSRGSKQLSQEANQDLNVLSWKTRKIVFTEASLEAVAATLSDVYGISIAIKTSIPPSCSVTVTFDHQTLEAVLNVLKDTLNLTYRKNGNQIEITQVGC